MKPLSWQPRLHAPRARIAAVDRVIASSFQWINVRRIIAGLLHTGIRTSYCRLYAMHRTPSVYDTDVLGCGSHDYWNTPSLGAVIDTLGLTGVSNMRLYSNMALEEDDANPVLDSTRPPPGGTHRPRSPDGPRGTRDLWISMPVAVHETHASWVFVAGDRAYKIKKPIALGFLDYSTLARRRSACREEVRVNRELAPGLYLGVRAIVRTGRDFAWRATALLERVEYAVEMRSFPRAGHLRGPDRGGLSHPRARRRGGPPAGGLPPLRGRGGDWGPDRVLAAWRKQRGGAARDGPSGRVASG